ncbi:MAG: thiamine-phosphate kinase [Candidatus Caldatribacteriaceae bacterium]
MNTLQDLGEFGLIRKLENIFHPSQKLVITGIGDDCAVIEGREGFFYLVTCDTQVEKVHFLSSVPPRFLGRRILSVNLSDIAAMGGVPIVALLSFVLRPSVSLDFLETLIEGLHEEAKKYKVDIVGGNLSRTDGALSFEVTMLGEVERGRPLPLRSCARVGDAIVVTGFLGESRAGLSITLGNDEEEKEKYRLLWERYCVPQPRIEVGRFLGSLGERIALIDISDGLVQDLLHVTQASGVGAILYAEAIPLSPLLREWCKRRGEDPLQLALGGGEDFELLFTMERVLAEEVVKDMERLCGVQATIVGEVIEERNIFLSREGKSERLVLPGWNHFQG